MARQKARIPAYKRIHLTGWKPDGYTVVIKDNETASTIVHRMPAPSYRAGNAIVRALRNLEKERGSIL